jgi:hypothetical protein
MNSVRKAVIKLFCASMIVLALLLTEYGFVQDSAFRRQLIIITGECGVLTAVLLSIQIICKTIRFRLTDHAPPPIPTISSVSSILNAAFTSKSIASFAPAERQAIGCGSTFRRLKVLGTVQWLRSTPYRP